MKCSRTWEARALDEGRLSARDASSFDRHASGCAACHHELAALEKLRLLARQLEGSEPSELELRRLRARVLHDAMHGSAPRGFLSKQAFGLVAAAFVAVAVALALWVRRDAKVDEVFAATVTAARAAEWTQRREGDIERVVLRDGDITLHVRKQRPDERFLVVVPDGEVEVRGTTFEVSVHRGVTARVRVESGVVVVRVHGESTLSAGDTWPVPVPPGPDTAQNTAQDIRPDPVSPDPGAPAQPVDPAMATPPPGPPRRSARRADAAAAVPKADQVADAVRANVSRSREIEQYEHAIESYRLGRFEDAEEQLRVFVASYPSSGLLDDAMFIEASSAASAGHADAAADVALLHLERFPQSFHRKDAAIIVARGRRGRGDCAGVRAILRPWLAELPGDPVVRAALGGCGEGLDNRTEVVPR